MLIVERTEELRGSVNAPPSKSYTHRAVICASVGDGVSKILNPLNSEDCLSSVNGCVLLGAKIDIEDDIWVVEGNYNSPRTPDNVIDVKNSGTTLRILTGISSQIPKG
ncbi:MAG TPA: 3-phosphoshikimate 1-carboxyvinyltransferase, partial [Methanothermococcus okinawensis]|nr:3-phosphoshikimate 1-carboxyvinyltransferase [Methanothermococcus okinawensis]